jgi:hypothetical protein
MSNLTLSCKSSLTYRLLVMDPKAGTHPVPVQKHTAKLDAPVVSGKMSDMALDRDTDTLPSFHVPRATSSLLAEIGYPNLAEFSLAAMTEST